MKKQTPADYHEEAIDAWYHQSNPDMSRNLIEEFMTRAWSDWCDAG
jgi:hypothetical protein